MLILLLAIATITVKAQGFYDLSTIQSIDITFSQTNWDYMLDTAAAGSEGYIMAQSVTINGVVYDSVGVKYKGNSSYNPSQVKNPFHIALDAYKNQDYQGYTDIKLSNVSKDPSFVHEVLSYKILRQYMHAPQSNYANVSVNGALIGLYVSSESISKKFINNHFYTNSGAFFKCNPIGGAGPGSGTYPDLVYYGTDSSLYTSRYEMNSNSGWGELIQLCDSLNSNIASIEKILDVDRALWMLAFDNVLVNLDSYIGQFQQNYYLYRDQNMRFNPVIWDLNESFGTFSMTGTISLPTTTSKQQMTPLLHLSDPNWPLVKNLLAIPVYKRMYIAHMRTIINENFVSGDYYTTAQNLQTLIDAAVNADPNKFYTYTQFHSNLTTDVSSGMTNSPGLSNLMNARATWLLSQSDFTPVHPTISNIAPTSSAPAVGSNATFRATVSNASSTGVYLGYRYDIEAPFKRILMYDDGLHNDSLASDGIFGVDVPVNSAYIQYYIYAENGNAGEFSPERAEYEYYTLNASYSMASAGQVVINEILASNSSTAYDAAGESDDYIELYNNSANLISCANLYLSDDFTNPLKWQFPGSASISPNSFLIIWADNDTTQPGLHANFKLSSTGEELMLSYPGGIVLDSLIFGAQTTDISLQRCPNGAGSFIATVPTYNSTNCVVGIAEQEANSGIQIYPNPANDQLTVDCSEKIEQLQIYNTSGQLQMNCSQMNTYQLKIDLSQLSSGLYLIRVNDNSVKKLLIQK